MRRVWLALLVLLVALLGATRFWPTVERVEVSGMEHLNRATVMRLARVAPGDPLLWITHWRLRDLTDDPWVRRARVIRHWPDAVSLRIWEREPLARQGDVTWAQDGTVLPMARDAERNGLVRIDGWGAPRVGEALELATLMQRFEPEAIHYSPKGFEIRSAEANLFTPDVASLRRHWAAIESQYGGRMAVYPWGVSKAHE